MSDIDFTKDTWVIVGVNKDTRYIGKCTRAMVGDKWVSRSVLNPSATGIENIEAAICVELNPAFELLKEVGMTEQGLAINMLIIPCDRTGFEFPLVVHVGTLAVLSNMHKQDQDVYLAGVKNAVRMRDQSRAKAAGLVLPDAAKIPAAIRSR